MSRFRPVGDGIRVDFEAFEIEIISDLRDSIREALEEGDVTNPVLHQLFPVAVRDDEIEDAAARMQFHDDLLEGRLAGLDALTEVLERATPRRGNQHRVTLVDDEPALFLGVLNDLRLSLASRIGIEHLRHRDLPDDDPRAGGIAVIDHLAWMQENLVRLIDPAASAHQDDPDFIARIMDDESDDL